MIAPPVNTMAVVPSAKTARAGADGRRKKNERAYEP